MQRRAALSGESGSSIPLILLCFLIALLLIMGVTTASAAFIAQRTVQSDCDGAAIAAASAVDLAELADVSQRDLLPLAANHAQLAVDEYRNRVWFDDPTAVMSATIDGAVVTVKCQRVVHVPFGAVFGWSDGLLRETTSSARAPLRGSEKVS